MRVRLQDRLPLLLILLVGATLRLYRLGADSLWYDETVSVYLAGSPIAELIRHTAGDIHPPGYYVLLRGWLLATGYPTGHASPAGIGLEFAAGFFSLFFGVAVIALVYSLARSLAGRTTSLAAAAVVAVSPYNIWYSQEARMYTLAAGLGVVVLVALLRGVGLSGGLRQRRWSRIVPWAAYSVAAAAGLYTLYYFTFLLLALNFWVLALWMRHKVKRDRVLPWLLANLAAVVLYAPWAPVTWRQATAPPVPPWRSATGLLPALRESGTALALGQSAPAWVWPVLLMALLLYAVGLFSLLGVARRRGELVAAPASPVDRESGDGAHPVAATFLPVATFGSLALVLLGSAATVPLYHVRYVFIYSPAFYVALASGLVWVWGRWKAIAAVGAAVWMAGAAVTLHAFWNDPAYRSDDLRQAAAFLESRWRPGDVVVVNAGYAYPGLLTYWQGSVGLLERLSPKPPSPRADGSLVALMTGHVGGDPTLGWGDTRSDFFAIRADQAAEGLKALFAQFPRVWQYRIYDTVNDPDGQLRAVLEREGQPIEDRVFAGEANMRVQAFVSRAGDGWTAEDTTVRYSPGLELQWDPLPSRVDAGETLYPTLRWRASMPPAPDIATSIRLVGSDGAVWSQPPDEQPLGELFPAHDWPADQTARQPLALPVPLGTPPGEYTVQLMVYDPASKRTWEPNGQGNVRPQTPAGLAIGRILVQRPDLPSPVFPSLGQFGPLALIAAGSPATTVAPGDEIPTELTWQATQAPGEPMVVVLQLLDVTGQVVAGLEAQPLDGRYPTQEWAQGEVVRDRHTLVVPAHVKPGRYRLIAGLYRAVDRERLRTRAGLLGESDHIQIKQIEVN